MEKGNARLISTDYTITSYNPCTYTQTEQRNYSRYLSTALQITTATTMATAIIAPMTLVTMTTVSGRKRHKTAVQPRYIKLGYVEFIRNLA